MDGVRDPMELSASFYHPQVKSFSVDLILYGFCGRLFKSYCYHLRKVPYRLSSPNLSPFCNRSSFQGCTMNIRYNYDGKTSIHKAVLSVLRLQ